MPAGSAVDWNDVAGRAIEAARTARSTAVGGNSARRSAARFVGIYPPSAVGSEFDGLAEHYDETRGGEQRGDEYAADIDRVLPAGDGPILEIGVGPGVVALGLMRRGRAVVGLDVSAPMLDRARPRLGPVLVRSDAMHIALASRSVAHAVSVWVVQSVRDPMLLFREAARVIRPGGRYVVCATQVPVPDDPVGTIMSEMTERIEVHRAAPRPRRVTTDQVLEWAGHAGFEGTVRRFDREWSSPPSAELAAIAHRQWPALRELDEAVIEEVTLPAVAALSALPDVAYTRRATAETVILVRPS